MSLNRTQERFIEAITKGNTSLVNELLLLLPVSTQNNQSKNYLLYKEYYDQLIEKEGLLDLSQAQYQNALNLAARHGQLEIIKTLLNLPVWGLVANFAINYNHILCVASDNHHRQVVEYFLEFQQGICPVLTANTLNYVFHNACCDGYTEIFNSLLKNPQIDPGNNANTPIGLACDNGHMEIVKLLLQDPRVDPADDKNYAIRMASDSGHADVVKLLLADPRVDPAAENNRAFRIACEKERFETIKVLLDDPRVDPAVRDNWAIRFAANHGFSKVVKLLLTVPAIDPNAKNHTPIGLACEKGYIETVKILLNDPRIDPAADDNYAFKAACEQGRTDIVKLLLDINGVDPAAQDNYSIKKACENGHVEVVKILLNDSRVNAVNENDPLHKAIKSEHTQIIEILLLYYKKNNLIISDQLCSIIFKHAITQGSLPLIQQILHFMDGKTQSAEYQYHRYIIDAAKQGDERIVNFLLRYFDKSLFTTACHNNHIKLATSLLDRLTDFLEADDINSLLQSACKQGHYDISALLLRLPLANPAADNYAAVKNVCWRAQMFQEDKHLVSLLNDERIDRDDLLENCNDQERKKINGALSHINQYERFKLLSFFYRERENKTGVARMKCSSISSGVK